MSGIVKARHRDRGGELELPGDFSFTWLYASPAVIGGMIVRCPNCATDSAIRFESNPNATPGQTWKWDGNRESPTLSPSVFESGCCGWHGWLIAGEWRPA